MTESVLRRIFLPCTHLPCSNLCILTIGHAILDAMPRPISPKNYERSLRLSWAAQWPCSACRIPGDISPAVLKHCQLYMSDLSLFFSASPFLEQGLCQRHSCRHGAAGARCHPVWGSVGDGQDQGMWRKLRQCLMQGSAPVPPIIRLQVLLTFQRTDVQIVCTLGPKSRSVEILEDLLKGWHERRSLQLLARLLMTITRYSLCIHCYSSQLTAKMPASDLAYAGTRPSFIP